MKTVFAQFARSTIILLMLFTQSAMIEHAIAHTETEHTEHCAAFMTADNPAVNSVDFISFDGISLNSSWVQLKSQLFIHRKFLYNLSRAPPKIMPV